MQADKKMTDQKTTNLETADLVMQRNGRRVFLLMLVFFVVPIVVVIMMYKLNWKPHGERVHKKIQNCQSSAAKYGGKNRSLLGRYLACWQGTGTSTRHNGINLMFNQAIKCGSRAGCKGNADRCCQ